MTTLPLATPILARKPSATVEDVVRAIAGQPSGEYRLIDVMTIVQGYYAVCRRVEVDPVLVIAQLVHETGNLTSWWSQRPRRNPAGIGVTGEAKGGDPRQAPGEDWAWSPADLLWKRGISFPSWEDHAIYAHVGRLLAYVLAPGTGTPAQQGLIAEALAYRPLSASRRGVARTLPDLNGKWAVPGTTYGQTLLKVAARLVAGGG